MRLTVVGSSSSIPRPNRACSSYLIQAGESSVVLDLGTGAFANLRPYVDYDRLDAIVITHMHADHFLDLVPLRYALTYGKLRRERKLAVYLPPGGVATLEMLVSAFADEGRSFLADVFELATYDPATTLRIGSAVLHFATTSHYIPAYAVRFEQDDCSVTYSADTAPDERVVALAHDSDVFVCEATLLASDVEHGTRGHSSAYEAGRMAQAAGVRRLMLTHYPSEATPADLAESARRAFDGEIIVLDDHAAFEIGSTFAERRREA